MIIQQAFGSVATCPEFEERVKSFHRSNQDWGLQMDLFGSLNNCALYLITAGWCPCCDGGLANPGSEHKEGCPHRTQEKKT